jgi:hypothetical protein
MKKIILLLSLFVSILAKGQTEVLLCNKEPSIAVKSPDGTCKVIMQNGTEKTQMASINVAGKQSLKVMIPAKALVAVVIKN